MDNYQVILISNTDTKFDITELCERVRWGGRKGSAPRTLEVTLLDDKNFSQAKIDIEEGQHCIFKVNGEELFRGILLKQTRVSSGQKCSFKAYDLGIYLANNTDTFVFKNKTASQIFANICKRFGIKAGTVAKTKYVIKNHTQERKKAWDCLLSALGKTYSHTKKRYYIRANKGKLSLLERKDHVIDYIIEDGVNLISYNETKSLEKVKTRVIMYNKKNKFAASSKEPGLEKKIGIFQDVASYDEDYKGKLSKLCTKVLQKNDTIDHTLNVNLKGNVNFISGNCIKVIIRPIDISRTFYIDSDTHTFTQGKYEVSLSLNSVNEKEWKDE